MINDKQAQRLWAVAYGYNPDLDAVHSLFCDAYQVKISQTALKRQLQALGQQDLIFIDPFYGYELTPFGMLQLLEYETFNPGTSVWDLDSQHRSKHEIGPVAHVIKYLLGERLYRYEPQVTTDSQQVFVEFSRTPFIWGCLRLLEDERLDQLAYAGWFNLLCRGEKSWADKIMALLKQEHVTSLDLYTRDLQLLEPVSSSDLATLPLPFTPENVRRKWNIKQIKSMPVNVTSLIDIAAVALYDDELAEQLLERYHQGIQNKGLLGAFAPEGLLLASQLLFDAEGYQLRLGEPDAWIDGLVEEGQPTSVLWGELLIELFMIFRWERLEPGVQRQFASLLQSHPKVESIFQCSADTLLASMARAALTQLLEPGNQIFFEQPSAWENWLGEVQRIIHPAAPEPGEERLAWILSDDLASLEVKIQKLGKKGWSKGRRIEIDDLGYRYEEMQSDLDKSIATTAYSRSRWDYRHIYTPITRQLALLLEQSDRVFDSSGDPVTIYRSHPLVVVDEHEKLLTASCYPELPKQPLVRNELGVVTLNDISESEQQLLTAIEQFPAGIPVDQESQLLDTFQASHQLAWYSKVSQQGNIQLLAWNSAPEICLSWRGLELEVSLICQPDDVKASYHRQGAGQGDDWIFNGQAQGWYQRDLDLERQGVKPLAKALGLRRNKQLRWKLPFEDGLDFIEKLGESAPAAIHWQGDTRLRLVSADQLSIDVEKKQNWFSISGVTRVDKDLELELRTLIAHAKGRLVHLDSGETLVISKALRRQLQLLNSVLTEDMTVDQRMAYPLAQLFDGMQHSGDDAWQQLIERWRQKPVLQDESLKPLRDYQLESVQWASHLTHHQFGACLADDMGLGKTLQALTLLRHYATQGPALVVVPKSVLHNWQSEAARFAPGLDVIDIESAPDRVQSIESAAASQLLLISYGMLTRLSDVLAEKEWQSVVLDEAQNIKNPTTKRAKVVFEMKAKVRLALTGTPIENHLVELWSLFNFINPGLLGQRNAFLKTYGKASESEEELARLRALVSPFIMRRTKGEVLKELPAKTEITHSIELSSKQRTAYEAVRKQVLADVKAGRGMVEVLSAMTRLRQVCCDPRLVFDNFEEAGSKLNEAMTLIGEALQSGHKILVFSQFVKLLKALEVMLNEQQVTFSYLDGQSSSSKRKQAIEAFKRGDTELFLISLKAGGTGLNLTEADMVIHLDPWWNPAVEDQASDRAHRMGQTKPVTVYRLVAENSIEEKIVALHQEKRELADKILSGQNDSQQLNPEMLLGLLTD